MCSLHPEATGIEDALNKHIRNGKKKCGFKEESI